MPDHSLLDTKYSGKQIKEHEVNKNRSTCGEEEPCSRGAGRIRDGKKPFGRPRHRQKGNIKMYLQEVE